MNYTRILICVGIMALVTYLPRALPLAIFKKKIDNPFVQSFLAYVPYAVLAAMTFPEIFNATVLPGASADVATICAGVFGLAAALLLAYKNKGLLTVALGATAAAFVAEQAARLIIGMG